MVPEEEATPDVDSVAGAPGGGARPGWADAVGIAWVVLAAVAVLVPALARGGSLGSYDLLGQYGLTAGPGAVHNRLLVDVIDQMIPWANLAWTQVHNGHLPLWNQYSGLGMPLAFNWQSSVFSVPSLAGYLVPLRLAYTCQVLVTMVIAGAGAYVLGRVLHLGVLASTFAGVAFELSGPFFTWVGWPIASVASWTGWILAGIVLIQRGRHRGRWVVLTGVAVACAVYAGQPDALVVLLLVAGTFAVVSLVVLRLQDGANDSSVRQVAGVASAFVLGALYSAPLLLPGLQLVSGSVRSANGAGALDAQHAFAPSLLVNGLTLSLVSFPNLFDFQNGGFQYVGAAAAVLAVAAVVFYARRPYVVALIGVGAVGLLLGYVNPTDVALNALPGLHAVRLPRGNIFLAFAVAALGAVGLQALVRSRRRTELVGCGALFVAAGVLLAGVWASGAGRVQGFAVLRAGSYLWVAGAIVLGLVAVGVGLADIGAPTTGDRAGARVAVGGLLVVFETAFLVAAGGSVWTSTADGTPPAPAVQRLERIVGPSVVGLGAPDCLPLSNQLGISPNANILYGVHELAVYDPMVPRASYSSWTATTGAIAGFPGFSHYCPGVTTAALARLYGVSYVLEPPGAPGPRGGVHVATLDREGLFRIPGAAAATVSPLAPGGRLPPPSAPGRAVAVGHPDPNSWTVTTRAPYAQVLRLRLTGVPGWHATVDGRPLALETFDGIMLQAVVPPGVHHVDVTYWPTRFTLGLVLASVAVALSIVALAWPTVARRLRRPPDAA
ncbi:MAG: YfhO family protein [Acidimicrobiales bacterium]|jgi:hypothetical protein